MYLLELLSATFWFWTFSVGFLVSIFASILLLCCSKFWWLLPIYAIWIWIDRKTCESGGRPIQHVRNCFTIATMRDYFSHKLIVDPKTKWNAQKNYIFACYPHGIYPLGPFMSLVNGYENFFPEHKTFTTALGIQFWIPFIREIFLGVGAVSVSAPSIKYLLSNEKGGNIVSIIVGGGEEAVYNKPGKYKIILNKRKGFAKMSLQTGSPVVPVFTFGETDVFEQLKFPGLEFVREIVKKILQIVIVVPKGDSLVFPKKVPLTTVVGEPIEVVKTEKPTNEDVEQLHQKFVESLKALFDEHKHKYVANPDQTILEIV